MGACHLKGLGWIWQGYFRLILYNLTYTILAQPFPLISIICCPGSEGDDIWNDLQWDKGLLIFSNHCNRLQSLFKTSLCAAAFLRKLESSIDG